jgi:hypothetical protein
MTLNPGPGPICQCYGIDSNILRVDRNHSIILPARTVRSKVLPLKMAGTERIFPDTDDESVLTFSLYDRDKHHDQQLKTRPHRSRRGDR